MSAFKDVPFVIGMMGLQRHDELLATKTFADWLEARVDEGLHWFDHADVYAKGDNERRFGEALNLRPALKSRIKVITKAGLIPAQLDSSRYQVKHYNTHPDYLNHSIDNALRRLNVDHIDYFLLHRPDPLIDDEATARVLDDAIEAGKIGAAGVHGFLPAQWRRLQNAMHHPLAAHEMELSIARSQALFDGLWDAMCLDSLTLLARSPLCGGRLFENQLGHLLNELAQEHNASPGGIGLAWLRRIPGHPVPVVGTLRETRLQALRNDVEVNIDRCAWFALLEAARAHRVL
ncbi:aldo/keto reductase [Phytohalomonas tamaricis]|uniref:aldo/keto reductase n=1 Tax=Phytohalomonas tamaricis TaxID=2081032 RepID=UPI0021D46062|nr:aldo/keto reductase [Phytohalomonas tamaricis]